MSISKDDRVLPPFKRAANAQEQNSNSEPLNNEDFEFYGTAHSQGTVLGFRVLFANGKIAVIQYHDLVSPLVFDGAGVIELNTPHVILKITGRNLAELFYAL